MADDPAPAVADVLMAVSFNLFPPPPLHKAVRPASGFTTSSSGRSLHFLPIAPSARNTCTVRRTMRGLAFSYSADVTYLESEGGGGTFQS